MTESELAAWRAGVDAAAKIAPAACKRAWEVTKSNYDRIPGWDEYGRYVREALRVLHEDGPR